VTRSARQSDLTHCLLSIRSRCFSWSLGVLLHAECRKIRLYGASCALVTTNPERTILLRDGSAGDSRGRSGSPFNQLPNDVFILRGSAWARYGTWIFHDGEECEIVYQTCGTQSFAVGPRPFVSVMDEEMVRFSHRLHAETQLHGNATAAMLTQVFWMSPDSGGRGAARPLSRSPG